jgi:hypothetical protein
MLARITKLRNPRRKRNTKRRKRRRKNPCEEEGRKERETRVENLEKKISRGQNGFRTPPYLEVRNLCNDDFKDSEGRKTKQKSFFDKQTSGPT